MMTINIPADGIVRRLVVLLALITVGFPAFALANTCAFSERSTAENFIRDLHDNVSGKVAKKSR